MNDISTLAAEPFASKWKRRAMSIPLMLAITAGGIVAAPLIVVGATAYDLARLRFRLPTVRVYLFLLQYACNDSVEILAAPLYWVLAGWGTRLDTPASRRRHERIQRWSVEILARRMETLLGLRVDLDDEGVSALQPGPAIVLCRHVSIVDASLPSLLYHRLGYSVRVTVMAEMLADPGFDLLYGRLGSEFIPRENGPQARQAVARLASGLDRSTVAVLFPEGRLFRPDLLRHVLGRLAEKAPERAARLAGLRHVLPPRPGGVLEMLAAAPSADVVVVAHAGLDRFAAFGDLARAVPAGQTVDVTAWRIARANVPVALDEQIEWLDATWCRVDEWVHQHTT